MENNEMPVGFGMALAMNPKAMEKFASLPQNEKQKIINGTHNVYRQQQTYQLRRQSEQKNFL